MKEKAQGGDRGNQYVAKAQIEPLPESMPSTADQLAIQYGVSGETDLEPSANLPKVDQEKAAGMRQGKRPHDGGPGWQDVERGQWSLGGGSGEVTFPIR